MFQGVFNSINKGIKNFIGNVNNKSINISKFLTLGSK